MKKDKFYWKEKEYRRLEAREWEIINERRSAIVELDKPIRIGVQCTLTLRQDIANRSDSNVFWSIVKLATVSYSKNPNRDFWWNFQGNKAGKRYRYRVQAPHIPHINQSTYDKLPLSAKKWFVRTYYYLNSSTPYHPSVVWYSCTVPNFYFDFKYSKWYKTHVQVIDSDLESEYDFIQYKMQNDFRESYYKWSNAPKHFRKDLNRKERRRANQDLCNIGKEDFIEYQQNFRGAAWLWW